MNSSAKQVPDFEKRRGGERRQGKTPLFSRYSLTGRRTARRRDADSRKPYTPDRHSPKTFAAILVIVMLSIVDAILTMDLISIGAAEINPIMAYYLELDPLVFFWMKYLLTFAAIILILFNQEFYLFRSRIKVKVLYFLLMIPFVLVVSWELHLLKSIGK